MDKELSPSPRLLTLFPWEDAPFVKGHKRELRRLDDSKEVYHIGDVLSYGWRSVRVTSVSFEPLKAITQEGAKNEGVNGGCLTCGEEEPCECNLPRPDYVDGFAYHWMATYGEDSWFADTIVMVVKFEDVTHD
jgi:hypothetical protein